MTSNTNGDKQDERTQATTDLIERLDAVFATSAPIGDGRTPQNVYIEHRKAMAQAWTVTLTDPVARRRVQLDTQWSVTKAAREGQLTLLEVLLDLWVWNRDNFLWNVTLDEACRNDLLHNLRMNRYHDRAPENIFCEWSVSWYLDFPDEGDQVKRSRQWLNNHRHDLVHVCQSVLGHSLHSEYKDIHFPTLYSALAQFATDLLTYALAHGQGCSATQLNVRQLFFDIAHSRGGVLFARLLDLAQQYAPNVDQCGESLVHVLVRYAPLALLDKWASTPAWVDRALHSDWHQPSRLSHCNLACELSTYVSPTQAARLAHLSTLQQRWDTALFDALLQHFPVDLVRHMLLPYLEPPPGDAQPRPISPVSPKLHSLPQACVIA
jgi:hypothetical protein